MIVSIKQVVLEVHRRAMLALGWIPIAAWAACQTPKSTARPMPPQTVKSLTVPACEMEMIGRKLEVSDGTILKCVEAELTPSPRWEQM